MAQGRLIALACGGAVLLGGAAAELSAGAAPPAAILDWAVGAAWVAAAIRGRRSPGRIAALGLLTATAWFLATALSPLGSGALLAVAYRGPLLHWLAPRAILAGRRTWIRVVVVAGYAAALIGTTWAAAGTGIVAIALTGLLVGSSRGRGPADLRREDAGAAAVCSVLGVLWLAAALGLLPAAVLQVADPVTLLAAAWQLSRPASGLTPAIGDMVLDLGPTRSQASPVSASLASALADPGLRIRAHRPDLGWRDELGRPAEDPDSDPTAAGVTRIDTPDGGRVVLVHGPDGAPESGLARAAVAAAALVLERVAAEALVQHEAEEVRRSSARLVTVDDAERAALALRLERGPIAVLDEVGRSLRDRGDQDVTAVVDELGEVIDELHALASGLNPARIARGGLEGALRELAEGSGVPVEVAVSGPLEALDEATTALTYFVCAECVTNVVKHAGAGAARLLVAVELESVRIEVRDDGRGGASIDAGRGLQGLADRISLAGGSLRLESPIGGPTVVHAWAARTAR